MTLNIQAYLAQQSFAIGEKIPLILTVANTGPEVVPIIDPRSGGNHFRLRIQVAPNEWRVVTMAQVLAAPGVPPIIRQVQVPVRDQWTFEFDLTTLTRLDQPGNYLLVVDYEWQPGQPWASLPMPFQLVRPATGGLIVTPSEATQSGYHALTWWGANDGDARAFLLDFRIRQPEVAIKGAVEIARIPPDSGFTLSMSPANAPFPDRWVVWVNGGRVNYSYWARAEQDRLPAAVLPIPGFQTELIRPALANSAPGDGRPGCLIGLVLRSPTGSQIVPVEVTPDGRCRFAHSQTLDGDVRGAWATSPNDRLRLFVFAVQTGPAMRILAISSPPSGEGQPPVSWFTTDAEFLAGDIRLTPDYRVQVGLLIKRGNVWERLTFTAPDSGREAQPSVTPLEQGPGAMPFRVRLDGKGDLHTLFLRDGGLRYAAPGAGESWSHNRPVIAGNSADLLIPPNGRVVLVYYDFEKGPTFQRL